MNAPLRATTVLARSVRYYWRTHLGVILGAALGALVLTGALLVGDSVKATLAAAGGVARRRGPRRR